MKLFAPLTAILVALALSGSAAASTTIGSLPATSPIGSCNGCAVVQSTDSGPNIYTAPIRGVVTSFSVRSGTVLNSMDHYRLDVFTPVAAPNWTLGTASQYVYWPGTGAEFTNKPISWNTRVSILQGDHIGLDSRSFGGNTLYSYPTASALDTMYGPNTPGFDVGSTSTAGMQFTNARANVQAVIEPDADLDGYGDETQDGCPADRAEHGPCTAPALSDFKFSLNKFAVNSKGKVLGATRAASGTTIIETLSKAAHVTFVMNLKGTGRKVGKSCKKQTSKNRTRKKCTYYPKSFTFERDLPAGTSNLGFSGRIKVGSRTKTLPAGSYVATAYPFSIQSQLGGAIAKTTFKVVPATKHH